MDLLKSLYISNDECDTGLRDNESALVLSVPLRYTISNVYSWDCQGPTRKETLHLLCREPLKWCMICHQCK